MDENRSSIRVTSRAFECLRRFLAVRIFCAPRPTRRMSDHYDVIIIGTGAGGGTLLHKLAPSGKRILVLERGPFLPREKENWDTKVAFNTTRYFGPEVWYDKN